MSAKSRSVVAAAVVLLLLALSLSAQAQDVTGQAPLSAQTGGTISKTASPTQSTAVLQYWTSERLAAAQPMPMPQAAQPPRNPRTRPPTVLLGQTAAGGAAAANAEALARADYPQAWAAAESELADSAALAEGPAAEEGTRGVYTSYTVNKNAAVWQTTGHRPVGRLSFLTPFGTSYCSASVISGQNIIVTAAHCAYDTDTNSWYTNWVFTPAYRNGAAPYGSFPYQTCWVLTSWVNLSGGYNIATWADDDVAVCLMRPNSAGRSLSSTTGWFGRQWNYGYVRNVTNLGYAFNNYNLVDVPDSGRYMRLCAAETFQLSTNVMGSGCNWAQGMSGGPWTTSYDPFYPATTYVNNVNSGLYVGQQNLYGGRFTSSNIVILCNASGC